MNTCNNNTIFDYKEEQNDMLYFNEKNNQYETIHLNNEDEMNNFIDI